MKSPSWWARGRLDGVHQGWVTTWKHRWSCLIWCNSATQSTGAVNLNSCITDPLKTSSAGHSRHARATWEKVALLQESGGGGSREDNLSALRKTEGREQTRSSYFCSHQNLASQSKRKYESVCNGVSADYTNTFLRQRTINSYSAQISVTACHKS